MSTFRLSAAQALALQIYLLGREETLPLALQELIAVLPSADTSSTSTSPRLHSRQALCPSCCQAGQRGLSRQHLSSTQSTLEYREASVDASLPFLPVPCQVCFMFTLASTSMFGSGFGFMFGFGSTFESTFGLGFASTFGFAFTSTFGCRFGFGFAFASTFGFGFASTSRSDPVSLSDSRPDLVSHPEPHPEPQPKRKRSRTQKSKVNSTETSSGGPDDPASIHCPRKSVRTRKRRRIDQYSYDESTASRFTVGDQAAPPSRDVLVDVTKQLARLSFGTQTSIGHEGYLSWVSDLKGMIEGTIDNIKDLAVSLLITAIDQGLLKYTNLFKLTVFLNIKVEIICQLVVDGHSWLTQGHFTYCWLSLSKEKMNISERKPQ
ncbi:hypothetical protein F5051DRAFT_434285 [Lentinula edodes]|nr:hypothetical protein F5051DRAFT_434285 [Lentinula edodes]